MNAWHPQQYRREALERGADRKIVEYAARTGARTVQRHKDRIPVLSLGHLAHMAEVPYQFLRSTISRRIDPYRLFRIRKQGISDTDRYRVICIPDPALLRVQSWIAQNILSTATPHYASTGFAKGNNIVSAAHIHCNARWLIKLDIKRFFESITEIFSIPSVHVVGLSAAGSAGISENMLPSTKSARNIRRRTVARAELEV